MDEAFTAAAIAVIEGLKRGEVVSYGEVAEQAGFPGAARAVGNLLKHTEGLPWWRVVSASGRLVPGSEVRQARLLRAEGVEVRNGKVVRSQAAPRPRRSE
ncbi:MAG: MGMT family protein [Acidimicrobiia bacterium]|nr:MGMT family protein [Acidimicrobiia bacterium]